MSRNIETPGYPIRELPEADKPPCKHPDFNATIIVNKMPDVKRFVMDLTCTCKECGEPFVFLGLPTGTTLPDGPPVGTSDVFETAVENATLPTDYKDFGKHVRLLM